jgi:hypothetical protein
MAKPHSVLLREPKENLPTGLTECLEQFVRITSMSGSLRAAVAWEVKLSVLDKCLFYSSQGCEL